MTLIFGQDKIVADWYSKKWGHSLTGWYFAVGILDKNGFLVGAIPFHNYNGSNIEFSYYGPKTATLNNFRGIAHFCFNHLKVNRVTVCVPRKNKELLRMVPKFGFKVEGVLRHYYGPYRRDDAIVFGILASEGKRYLK